MLRDNFHGSTRGTFLALDVDKVANRIAYKSCPTQEAEYVTESKCLLIQCSTWSCAYLVDYENAYSLSFESAAII